jgi:IMP dehydrogenase
MKTVLSFDDVLLKPRMSKIKSRGDINLTSCLKEDEYDDEDDDYKITEEGVELDLPIMSSPMDTVTGRRMALSMARAGGLGIVHRYCSIEEQVAMIKDLGLGKERDTSKDEEHLAIFEARLDGSRRPEKFKTVVSPLASGAAIGVSGDYKERAQALVDAGCKILCIDVAHGHHILVKDALKHLKSTFGNKLTLIAGNVATSRAFEDLSRWGADAIRVGVGGGSICSTRIQTGHGIPTLQSIIDCTKSEGGAKIIADGGIRNAGDIVKAIAAGADFVMLGSLLAGTDESPGQVFSSADGKRYKVYRGMASAEAQIDWRGEARSLEGVSTTVPWKGSVEKILKDLEQNIRSGFSYTGAKNIGAMYYHAKFVRQTIAGARESFTHILTK